MALYFFIVLYLLHLFLGRMCVGDAPGRGNAALGAEHHGAIRVSDTEPVSARAFILLFILTLANLPAIHRIASSNSISVIVQYSVRNSISLPLSIACPIAHSFF